MEAQTDASGDRMTLHRHCLCLTVHSENCATRINRDN